MRRQGGGENLDREPLLLAGEGEEPRMRSVTDVISRAILPETVLPAPSLIGEGWGEKTIGGEEEIRKKTDCALLCVLCKNPASLFYGLLAPV